MRHVRKLLADDGGRDIKELAADERGQSLIIIALFFSLFMAIVGIAVDIAWFQFNVDRIQRAADAGALAGVVYLPGNLPGAQTSAVAAIKRNGYQNGVAGATVTVVKEPGNDKMLRATVTSPVRTFFARMFGIANFAGSRYSRAEFILPVPMGSPQNYYGINVLCDDGDTPPACAQVPDAVTAAPLTPLGFFGGVEFRGGDRANGDAYSTYYNAATGVGGLNVATATNGNTGYDSNGYSYIADFPAGTVNGSVWLYDPIFCATGGQSSTGRRLGVGDYWFADGGTPMTTVYKVMDMMGTPYDLTDDQPIAGGTKNYTSNGVDESAGSSGYKGDGDYGGGADTSDGPNCALDLAHNKWVLWASGLTEGQYRLQVVTSSGNPNENGINGFGIEVTSTAGPLPHVYGQSRMEAFIVINNTSIFYLAQVEAVHAGKFLEIKLFDPGDITSTNFKIRIPSATAPGYTYATFTYTSTGAAGCGGSTSGGPTTTLVTSTSSCKYYNNQWVTILAQIPTNYTAPVAPGDPAGSGGGWWKIEYATTGTGQDITTWQVNIRGNPVHLVVP
jgi:putative Flp pilus-assembly TadE/G-like protein